MALAAVTGLPVSRIEDELRSIGRGPAATTGIDLTLAAGFLGWNVRCAARFGPPRPSLARCLEQRDAEARVRGLLILIADEPGRPNRRRGFHWLAVKRDMVCDAISQGEWYPKHGAQLGALVCSAWLAQRR